RRWLCTQARANVVPTQWLGTVLQLPKLVTIHHGLDAVKEVDVVPNGGRPTVVFLGRLVSTKGVHVLMQAAHLLPNRDFEVTIIGDGPERARLEQDVRALGLESRVVF